MQQSQLVLPPDLTSDGYVGVAAVGPSDAEWSLLTPSTWKEPPPGFHVRDWRDRLLAREPVPVYLEAGASQDSLNAASTSCPRCSRPVGCHGYAPWSSWWCSACGVQDLSRSDFVYGCLSQTGCQNIYKWAICVNCSAKGTPNQQVNTTLPLIGEGTERFRAQSMQKVG